MQPVRFRDDQACLCAFTGADVHVTCPACSERAVVAPVARLTGSPRWWPRRLVCTRCTYTREHTLVVTGRRDHVGRTSFGSSLWLEEPCRGRVLWALNAPHLDALERVVGADLRERGSVPGTLSMVESLPAWITHAGHRDDVLRGIRRLRARLPVGA